MEVLFKDFLKLDIDIKEEKGLEKYRVVLQNGNSLTIEDHFFGKVDVYLNIESIPSEVPFLEVSIAGKVVKVPVIYGNDQIQEASAEINIGIDLIASTFFMLSRMEEAILPDRDDHERFPMESSLAWKNGFYHLPVVDIYIHLLADCLKKLDSSLEFELNEVKVIASHDLDHLVKWRSVRSWLGAVKRAMKFGSIGDAIRYSKMYFAGDDPFDNIDYLIELAKENETSAVFYFLVDKWSSYDQNDFDNYRFKADKYSEKIMNARFDIGLHPSYNTAEDDSLIGKEKEKMEAWLHDRVLKSRQHYLRFSVPETWENLEKAGITEESTMIYSKWPGFRCGTSRSFPVFDVLQKKKLNLIEVPLIFMDTAFMNDDSKTLEEKKTYLEELKNQVRSYGGNWHFLIHNSNFFWEDESEYFEIWRSLYKI